MPPLLLDLLPFVLEEDVAPVTVTERPRGPWPVTGPTGFLQFRRGTACLCVSGSGAVSAWDAGLERDLIDEDELWLFGEE